MITPKSTHRILSTAFVAACMACTAPCIRAGTVYDISIHTTGLSAVNGELVFDFTSGGGPSSNSLTISSFTTNGALGTMSTTGLVTGTLPATITLQDDPTTSVFNEYATDFTFGTSISFVLNATSSGPGPVSSPDELAVFLLGSNGVTSLITSSDPTGADSLFTFDISGSAAGAPSVYDVSSPANVNATVTPETSTVPEPSGCFLTGVLCVALARYRSRALPPSRLQPGPSEE